MHYSSDFLLRFIHTCATMNTHTHMFTCLDMIVYTYTFISIHTHACAHVFMCICIYIFSHKGCHLYLNANICDIYLLSINDMYDTFQCDPKW